jgi:hypothetical protein
VFRTKNDERWIQRDSLLEFKAKFQKRCEGLAEITRMSQEMGLYD